MKNIKNKIRCVGLVANIDKVSARLLIRKVSRLASGKRFEVASDVSTTAFADLNCKTFPGIRELAAHCDLLLVFGGDGTMLSVARSVAGLSTPICGINVGGLGFLTAVQRNNIPPALENLWSGNFSIEERCLIQADGTASREPISQVALNDFVVSRGAASRLIELQVSVNEIYLTNYRCDGLIVCSPTGSTAYSLAAGGAVVAPDAPVLTLTPICPHTLSNRSVIVSMDSIVQVKVLSQKLEVYLTADGQAQMPLVTGDLINIRRSAKTIQVVRLPGSSFFTTLRQKLNWSGSSL